MIELINIWKRFGRDWVLKDVNLKVEKPNLIAIVGENGSGKSTLLKIICGLIKPSKGVVKIFGRDLKEDRDYKKFLGVLLHENVLYEELTVDENLKFYSNIYGIYSDLAKKVYDVFGLERFGKVVVKDLSFGWKKRSNIVRALINDPKIVLFDEPFSGLDENGKEKLKDLMIELSKERIIIFTSPTEPDLDCKVLKIENGVLHDLTDN